MLLSVVKAAQLIIAPEKLCKVTILALAITYLQHNIGSHRHHHLGICMSKLVQRLAGAFNDNVHRIYILISP